MNSEAKIKDITIVDLFTSNKFILSQTHFYSYLTVITIGLVIFYSITYHLFDLLLMTWIVLCVSIWTVYINPKRQRLYPTQYYLSGVDLQIGHFIIHWIPFLIMFYIYLKN